MSISQKLPSAICPTLIQHSQTFIPNAASEGDKAHSYSRCWSCDSTSGHVISKNRALGLHMPPSGQDDNNKSTFLLFYDETQGPGIMLEPKVPSVKNQLYHISSHNH